MTDVPVDDEVDPNAAPAPTATAVLDYVVRAIVAEPEAVDIQVDDSGSTIELDVRVAPDDMGRVIGRRGRIANAIRTVVRAAAARDDTAAVEVEFLD